VVAICLAGGVPAAAAAPLADRYIVVLRDDADSQVVSQEHARLYSAGVTFIYRYALKGYAARIPANRLAALRADPRVAWVEADQEVSLIEPLRSTASRLPGIAAQTAPTGLRRIGASTDGIQQTLPYKGAGVGVAVIDTGINATHPDLTGSVGAGMSCVPGTPTPNDDNGHGTHVAGTIGAHENAIGVVGVAPSVTLYPAKVLNSGGSGQTSWVICGIDFVTSIGPAGTGQVQVANMSLGGSRFPPPYYPTCSNDSGDAQHRAICRSVASGVTYVVAAGNDAQSSILASPAAYAEVITVSALADFNGAPGGGAPATCRSDVDDTLADFSNFGPPVDIAAPGVCIQSTVPTGFCDLCDASGYNTISGTSMASPHVAGAAALYIEAYKGFSGGTLPRPGQVRAALRGSQEAGPIPGDPDAFKEGILHLPFVAIP
jgi:subtilisin family serine protease